MDEGAMTNDQYEMPLFNPEDHEIREMLSKYRVIAVVGLSDDPLKDSNRVAHYLIDNGYAVVPVNPSKTNILGLTTYPNLTSIPFPVDIVNIFRKPQDVPSVVDEAVAVGAQVVWMQAGIAHHESAKKAQTAGLTVVQNTCIKVEHARFFGA